MPYPKKSNSIVSTTASPVAYTGLPTFIARSTPVCIFASVVNGSDLYPKGLDRVYFEGSGTIGGIAGMQEAMSPAVLDIEATSSNDLLCT